MVKKTITLLIILIIGMSFLGRFIYGERIRNGIETLPKVSIVIDDLGNNFEIDKEIEKIESDLTLAILPFREDTKKTLNFFSNKQEIILHLPLEPISKNQKEERMITTSMEEREIIKEFNLALKELEPFVSGVNNHKGSLFTANRELMTILLKEVKRNNLFFIDSFTIGSSLGFSLSQEMGIETKKRDVFLDNSRNKEDIRERLYETILIAQQEGSALAIGHSFPETIEVLSEEIPKLKNKVDFVKASEIANYQNIK